MKVYVYEKKNKHKRVETITNVKNITASNEKFFIMTVDNDITSYDRELYMLSVYGY